MQKKKGDYSEPQKKNWYISELEKFIMQEVKVIDDTGKEFIGQCRAINFNHLNIVLMTGKEKIVIRNIRCIRRKRTMTK